MPDQEHSRPPTPELGVQLPAWQWPLDVGELRAWVQGAEELGFEWLGMPDHVFYAYDTPQRPPAVYPGGTIQHEALTVLAWIAGFTQRAALTTSVLVLPQRQAALVAKQAAEIDVLSGGRLRLGVGIGWQEAEFDGLGRTFDDRGARIESDIAVLRACWADEPISLETPNERIDQLSMLPKPTRRGGPPLLYGGVHPRGIDRAARLCDGWIAMTRFDPARASDTVGALHERLRVHGRDPATFPLQATIPLTDDDEALASTLHGYLDAGLHWLGLHLPGLHGPGGHGIERRLGVDAHLARLATVRRDIWPAVSA